MHATTPPPSPDASREELYEQARALHAECAEARAVLARVKEHVALWKNDKRMRLMGEILLESIARIEQEERERTAREGRGA